MRKFMKITSAAIAAAMLTGTLAANVSAAQNDIKAEPRTSYTTPMSTDKNSAEYKNFTSAKPKLRKADDGWYGYTLEWDKVEGAMLYYIIGKSGSKKELIGKTSDTFVYLSDIGGDKYDKYFIKAVTYDYNDNRVTSKESNIIGRPSKQFNEYDGLYGTKPAATNSVTAGVSYDSTTYEEEDYEDEEYEEYEEAEEEWEEEDVEIEETDEEYSHYDPNAFKKAATSPLSTFSADVDTASYANVRRMVNDNYTIYSDSVRTEEFINYFDYDYIQPTSGTFSVTYEYSECPWNKDNQMVMVGIQAKDIEKEPNSNLVFLVDISGSMYSQDKLPLVADTLKKLSRELTADDRLSIVTYSGNEKVVVAGAYGNMKNCIADVADSLIANGCTNGEAGINMAYDIASQYYIKGGNNRVILATDGDLNVGISSQDELSKFISEKRVGNNGVYLTVLGVGTGNLKDNKMETLAKDGNGNYYYIDCAKEATKVLVDERKATLFTVADDVKFQVEFNPALVDSYRLVGYEGRRLNNEDFANDKKDAAEVGAGQSVTVMYEIIPADTASTESLKYQKATGNKTDICTVKIRYKQPGQSKSTMSKVAVKKSSYLPYKDTGVRFRFATCVAETALALKGDEGYEGTSIANARARFKKLTKDELAQIGYSDDFADVLEKLYKKYGSKAA